MSAATAATFEAIPLPAPVGRRMRLGPFPSARDALKFAGYAAVGGVAAAALGAVAWLPILGGGFLLSIHKPEGRGLDDRLGDYLRWRFRTSAFGGRGAERPAARARGAVARLADGRFVGGLEADGIPVAFLPPEEARRLFEGYRRLLDGLDRGCLLRATLVPLSSAPFLPPRRAPEGDDEVRRARDGYAEMVRLLCRRRFRRAVYLLLWSDGAGGTGSARLAEQVAHVGEELERLGIPNRRLRSRELAEALGRTGWSAREGG